jgi:large subunit ribosomal protein L14e
MKTISIAAGRIVCSKAGRDAGRLFVVLQVVDEDFVLVADGRLRTLDRPKKKRKKHLKPTRAVVSAVERGEAVMDHELRQWISEEEGKLVQI